MQVPMVPVQQQTTFVGEMHKAPIMPSSITKTVGSHTFGSLTLTMLCSTLGAAVGLVVMKASQRRGKYEVAAFSTTSEKLATMYGPTRNLFLGPLSESAPAYLTGEFAGDYGFDVAGLASNPKRLERYRQAEIMNGRWAMLGVVGCVAPELLAKVSGVEYGDYGVWFKAGAQVFDPAGINYLGNPSLIHAQSITLILVTEILLMGAAEGFRVGGGPLGPAKDPVYPGGAFDPLGLTKDADAFAELKVKEVKNGRLAMLGMLGLFMQGFATGKGPVDNLLTHLANPGGENIVTFHSKVLGGALAMV
jgi:hypothetical protein